MANEINGYVKTECNLRAGPSTYDKSRGKVGKNRRITALDIKSKKDWVLLRVEEGSHKGETGWIHRDCLHLDR